MFDHLFPIIVPRSYFSSGRWPGFHRRLRHEALAVTWVGLDAGGGMAYVNMEEHERIEAAGVDVHTQAMENLRHASEDLTTHLKAEGERVLFRVMMHGDGLGSSRLLLLPEIAATFPDGAWLAIPERSCGLLVPKYLSDAERAQALEVVQGCYAGGGSAMLPGLHEAALFELDGPVRR